MAQLHLQPPEPFNFRTPDDWPRWLRWFEQFREAASLTEDSDKKQVNTLLYCLGEEAEAVLSSTNITEEERAVYTTVVSKFDAFFQVGRNVIFERARFNRRNQLGGETAEQYIMELYKLAKSCNYGEMKGEMKDEMIRDRLVVGIRDNALSQRLQLDADLTLEKAKKMVRQREAVGEQQQLLKGTVASSLDELQPRRDRRKQGKKFHVKGRANSSTTAATQPQSKSCTRCGKGQHPRDKCPAKDATCHRCSKKGHYGSQCFTNSSGECK